MATSDSNLSATMLGGSDSLYDCYCYPCSTDGQHLEAAGFCKTCAVYLCSTCYNAHRISPASVHHKLMDAATMPRTTIYSKPRDVLTQPCDRHPDKIIEYYCKADGDLCCSGCLNMDHASCKPRSYIPDISASTSAGREYKDITIDLDRLTALATEEDTFIVLDEDENDTYKSMAVANISSSRHAMDKLLDDAEKRALQRVDTLHKQNAAKINSASQKCQYVLSEASTMTVDLEKKAREGQANQLFVAMKMAGRCLPAMEEEIRQLKTRKISHYMLDKDATVQYFRSTLSVMFSVTVSQDRADTHVKARHMTDVNVKSIEDSKDCTVNGCMALSGDRLVVTDYGNNAVKLVDVSLNKVISRFTLSSKPLDITTIDQDQFAVALGQVKTIEIFKVTDTLTLTKSIDVPGTGFISLFYEGDTFMVLDQTSRAVKMVDMTGRVVSTVYTDNDSNPLFKKPRYLTLDRDRGVMYITDWKTDTVTCMTLSGRVIWVYTNAGLQSPRGVAVGRDGDIMVCGGDSQSVQLLSCSGKLVQVLLDKSTGLGPGPQAICVYEDKVWVTSYSTMLEHKNYVSMFQWG